MVLSETKQRRQSQFRGKEKNPRTCRSDKHKDSGIPAVLPPLLHLPLTRQTSVCFRIKTPAHDHGRVPPQSTAVFAYKNGFGAKLGEVFVPFVRHARLSSSGCFLCTDRKLLVPFIAFMGIFCLYG
jgi:hypothetical protein